MQVYCKWFVSGVVISFVWFVQFGGAILGCLLSGFRV